MTFEGWKAIAVQLEEATGLSFSAEAARGLSRRARDPLPVTCWRNRVSVTADVLDAWVEKSYRQARTKGGPRRPRRPK